MKRAFFLITSFLYFIFFIACNKSYKGIGSLKKQSIEFDGKTRNYWLYIPKDYKTSGNASLLLGLHGRGGNGKNAMKYMKFNPYADAHNFICVYPDGFRGSWNDEKNESPALKAGIDDLGFLDFLITQIKEKYSINEKRIYAAGMSNGGFMTLFLACKFANKFAAVASVTGIMAPEPASWCLPSQSIPVLLIGGTNDPIVPYKGGKITNNIQTVGFEEAFVFWKKNNACKNHSEIISLPNNFKDGTMVEIETYNFCTNGSEVILYRIKGGGHTWPGGTQYLPKVIIGRRSKEFNAEKIIFDFFMKHQLQ